MEDIKNPQADRVQMIIMIDPELKRRAKVFAAEWNSTLRDVVCFALKDFLDRQDGIEPDPVDPAELEIH